MPAETANPTPCEKKGRGRPLGSKSKNRIHEESILIPRPVRRPLHYNQVEAAAELGMSAASLYYRETTEKGIFQPALKEGKSIIYTATQIEIMSLVMRKRITNEQGMKLWREIEDAELMDMVRRTRGGDV